MTPNNSEVDRPENLAGPSAVRVRNGRPVARHGYWHPTGPSMRGSPCARIAVREHGAAGEVNLRRKDGSIVGTAYWVIETTTRAHAYLRLSWLLDVFCGACSGIER